MGKKSSMPINNALKWLTIYKKFRTKYFSFFNELIGTSSNESNIPERLEWECLVFLLLKSLI